MYRARIPKDLRKYKTKVVGPLTGRQAACAAVIVCVDLVIYGMLRILDLGTSFLFYVILIADVPIAAFAFDIDGVPMESFIKDVLLWSLARPKERTASFTDHDDEDVMKVPSEIKETSKEEKARKKEMKAIVKDHPELRPYE